MKHLIALACLLAALCGPAAIASPIHVTPTPATVTQGQSFDVTVSGVIDPADGIGALTFLLSFDPSMTLVPNSVTLGSILNGWTLVTGEGPGSVNVSIADYPTDITVPDSGGQYTPFFSLQLTTSLSTPALQQSITVSPDPNDNGVPGAYQFEATSGSLSVAEAVQPVPAPGALVIVPALLALMATRRRA